MSDQLILVSYIIVAWIIHSGLTTLYMQAFDSVASLYFRIAHALEIFITTLITLFLYMVTITDNLPNFEAVGIVLATLIVLDFIGLIAVPKLRTLFDPLHFATAYTVITAAVLISYAIA